MKIYRFVMSVAAIVKIEGLQNTKQFVFCKSQIVEGGMRGDFHFVNCILYFVRNFVTVQYDPNYKKLIYSVECMRFRRFASNLRKL